MKGKTKKPADKEELSVKRRKFAQEYIVDLNGLQAAIRAGYSKRSASVTATRLLADANVQAEIQRAMDIRAKRTSITADYVIKSISEVSDEARTAGEFSAALKGYELLGRHLKLFTDRVESKQETTVRGYIVVPSKTGMDTDA